jgi:nucleotide-binding universal stress UspA family protein
VSIKRILVHADATPEGLQRARTARKIADAHKAELEALVISALPAEAYGPGADAIHEAVLNQRKKVEAELARTSEAVTREIGASVHSFRTRIDRMRIDAATAMRSADLVVVGPPLHDGFLHHDDVFHAALFSSGLPCLVLPYIAQPYEGEIPLFGQRVLIAWKDCREAARAVHDAMPFLERAGAIAVVAIMPEDDPRFFGQPALDRLASALRTRGLPVEAVHARPARGGVHHALLREAEEFRADTIVMGGYGRARLSEFVFGGMTHSMLTRMHRPILMSH